PLNAVLVTGPAIGELDVTGVRTCAHPTYPDFVGTDSFVYQATDGTNSSNEATVTLIVNAINEAPTAENDEFSLDVNTVLEAPARSEERRGGKQGRGRSTRAHRSRTGHVQS